ncbi:hypothetical protein X73_00275 [Pasteurella multocida subsp. gallicida X73]|nr:hypothetical protein NT08PM_1061 [Pasteurella multocida subsp. multocida str. 3480]EJZ80110.1 hypothetical protein X73_00275 [Pasteurella multocida subsp. gallicida X73]
MEFGRLTKINEKNTALLSSSAVCLSVIFSDLFSLSPV